MRNLACFHAKHKCFFSSLRSDAIIGPKEIKKITRKKPGISTTPLKIFQRNVLQVPYMEARVLAHAMLANAQDGYRRRDLWLAYMQRCLKVSTQLSITDLDHILRALVLAGNFGLERNDELLSELGHVLTRILVVESRISNKKKNDLYNPTQLTEQTKDIICEEKKSLLSTCKTRFFHLCSICCSFANLRFSNEPSYGILIKNIIILENYFNHQQLTKIIKSLTLIKSNNFFKFFNKVEQFFLDISKNSLDDKDFGCNLCDIVHSFNILNYPLTSKLKDISVRTGLSLLDNYTLEDDRYVKYFCKITRIINLILTRKIFLQISQAFHTSEYELIYKMLIQGTQIAKNIEAIEHSIYINKFIESTAVLGRFITKLNDTSFSLNSIYSSYIYTITKMTVLYPSKYNDLASLLTIDFLINNKSNTSINDIYTILLALQFLLQNISTHLTNLTVRKNGELSNNLILMLRVLDRTYEYYKKKKKKYKNDIFITDKQRLLREPKIDEIEIGTNTITQVSDLLDNITKLIIKYETKSVVPTAILAEWIYSNTKIKGSVNTFSLIHQKKISIPQTLSTIRAAWCFSTLIRILL